METAHIFIFPRPLRICYMKVSTSLISWLSLVHNVRKSSGFSVYATYQNFSHNVKI